MNGALTAGSWILLYVFLYFAARTASKAIRDHEPWNWPWAVLLVLLAAANIPFLYGYHL